MSDIGREHVARREIVEAGAGCGKTYGLVSRYIEGLGYDPETGAPIKGVSRGAHEIMALTFTEDAAAEMKARILERLATLGLSHLRVAVLEESRIGTFHSLCLRLLRPHLATLGYDHRGHIVPTQVAREARVRHALKRLADHPRRSYLLARLDLRTIAQLSAQLWFRPAGSLTRKAMDFSEESAWLKSFTDTCRAQLEELCAANPKLNDDAPSNWIRHFRDSLDAPTEAAAAKITFRSRKLNDAHPELHASAKLWREFLKNNWHESFKAEALRLDTEAQRELETFYAELRDDGPKLLDYAALEFELHALLKSRIQPPASPAVLLVDEFQDTNRVQYEILEALSMPATEWYFVGDPKQSIYKFRGAEASLFGELKRALAPLSLSDNYRSSPAVLEFVNSLQRLLFAGERPLDPPPQFLHSGKFKVRREDLIPAAASENFAAVRIVAAPGKTDFAPQLADDFSARQTELGPDATHAALFTSWKRLYAYAAELTRLGVAFEISGSEPYIDHHLTPLFAAALEWIERPELLPGPVALNRWRVEAPWNGLVPTTAELAALRALWGERPEESAWVELLHRFASIVRPSRWIRGAEWAAAMERLLLSLEAAQLPYSMTLGDLAKFLVKHAATFETDLPGLINGNAPGRAKLMLYTVHGSKGLEFDAVYLPELTERARGAFARSFDDESGVAFRVKLAGTRGDARSERPSLHYVLRARNDERQAEAESRRLFYVATTRAKRSLNIYFHAPADTAREPTPDPGEILGWAPRTPRYWNHLLVDLKARGHLSELERAGALVWRIDEVEATNEASPEESPELWNWPQAPAVSPAKGEFFREGVSRYIERQFVAGAPAVGRAKSASDMFSHAEIGTQIHRVLEIWNGDAATLHAVLPAGAEQSLIRDAVTQVRALAPIQDLWTAIAANDVNLRREFGVYVHSPRYRLSGFADLVWLRDGEIWLVDWKTSARFTSLTRQERLAKIRLQLKLYAESFGAQRPRVHALAVGIEISPERRARAEIILDESF